MAEGREGWVELHVGYVELAVLVDDPAGTTYVHSGPKGHATGVHLAERKTAFVVVLGNPDDATRKAAARALLRGEV